MGRLSFAVLCLTLVLAGAASAQVRRWGSEGPKTETSTPVAITGIEDPPTAIAASNRSGYALERNETVMAWGTNTRGELGDGSHVKSDDAAVKVEFPRGVKITAIGEARASGWFVDSTGHVWSTGEGGYCSKESDLPEEVPGLSEVVAVQGGEQHVLFLLANGKVMACGVNVDGELGLPKSTKETKTPTEVPGLSEVAEVSAGQRQSLVRTKSGHVYAFGNNAEGQICMSKTIKKLYTPTEVRLPGRASAISAGGNITSDGTSFIMVEGIPYGCGDDSSGQVGDGQTVTKYAPTVATELVTLEPKQVVTAGATTVALSATGDVYTVGSDQEGALGNGSESGFSLTPFAVGGGAVEVSATAWDILDQG